MRKLINRQLLVLGLISLPVIAAESAQAQLNPNLDFFGEDVNTGPPGSDANPPLIGDSNGIFDGFNNAPVSNGEEAAFIGSLTNFAVEDFEDVDFGSLSLTVPRALTFETPGGDVINASLFGDGGSGAGIRGTEFQGTYNTTEILGASRFALIPAQELGAPEITRVVFEQDITGFGASTTDVGDKGGLVFAALLNDGVGVAQVQIDVTTPGDLGQPEPFTSGSTFFAGEGPGSGFVFDEVLFATLDEDGSGGAGVDGFGLDDFIIAFEEQVPPPTGTPEPSALIGLGILGAAGFVSRRKKGNK